MGPGGLTRERAGFEVRDVHPTHYGRICPIETPEGPNIGLINSLATHAVVNKYGFIESPYRRVIDGKITDEVIYMSAMEEAKHVIAQANIALKNGEIVDDLVPGRINGEPTLLAKDQVDLMDVSPKQVVSVAASLIPFLENDDANRALMGSNMQKQAVPLIQSDAPLVGTGMESVVARDSGATVVARRKGVVEQLDGTRIVVRATEETDPTKPGVDIYRLAKFQRSNTNTCINQRPLVRVGDRIEAGDTIADGPSTDLGELALGRNALVAFMPWNGYNFEDFDPDLRAHRARRRLHLDPYRGVRGHGPRHQARAGRDHPRHPQRRRGSAAQPRRGGHRGDRRRSAAGRYPGRQGHAEGRKPDDAGGKAAPRHLRREGLRRARHLAAAAAGRGRHRRRGPRLQPARRRQGRARAGDRTRRDRPAGQGPRRRVRHPEPQHLRAPARAAARQDRRLRAQGPRPRRDHAAKLDEIAPGLWWQITLDDDKAMGELEAMRGQFDEARKRLDRRFEDKVDKLQRGDELPPGVMKMVKVFVAVKRKLQPGDKMAGRHGNKGVISKILPIEDMPHLEDGTAVDVVLNPLGVPSRMNVGQIFETHLGWASAGMGRQIAALLEAWQNGGQTQGARRPPEEGLRQGPGAAGHRRGPGRAGSQPVEGRARSRPRSSTARTSTTSRTCSNRPG